MRENRTYGLTRGLEREIALFPALLYRLCGEKKSTAKAQRAQRIHKEKTFVSFVPFVVKKRITT